MHSARTWSGCDDKDALHGMPFDAHLHGQPKFLAVDHKVHPAEHGRNVDIRTDTGTVRRYFSNAVLREP